MIQRPTLRNIPGGEPNYPSSLPFDVVNDEFIEQLVDYLLGILQPNKSNLTATTVPVNNTIADTPVYTETILGNTLGVNGLIRRKLTGYISSDVSLPGGITLTLKYGMASLVFYEVDDGSLTPGLDHEPFQIEIELAGKGGTSSQLLTARFTIQDNVVFLAREVISQDSTQDLNFQVSAAFTQANINNEIAIESGG